VVKERATPYTMWLMTSVQAPPGVVDRQSAGSTTPLTGSERSWIDVVEYDDVGAPRWGRRLPEAVQRSGDPGSVDLTV
jgi:hypothetical protein